jgi:hypothetical protein
MNKNDSFLLIFIFFGVFGLIIWLLLKYSENTYGKYSPLKISRSYEISAFQYFTKLDNYAVYYLGVLSIYCLIKLPDAFSPSKYIYDWRYTALLLLICIIFIGLFLYYLNLLLNYWKHTRNICITYQPEEKIVEISFPEKKFIIQEGDIKSIEMIRNGGKIQFGYFVYTLTDGESFILTDRMPGTWAIQEYFRRIPCKMTEKRFPFIK